MSMSDFAAEMIRLETEAESKNILIYGDSNAGKTVLAGTCPGKTFWLVGEPGYKSAARMGARGHARRIADTATAWAAVEWLEYRERYRQLDWMVLDGISTMQDRFRIGYAQEAFDINPAKRQHRNLPDKPDYFNTQNFLKAWLPRLVDMPVNLLITAHAWRTNRTDDGELVCFPGIQGKGTETANAVCGLMDAVGYLEVKPEAQDFTNRLLWRRSKRDGVTYWAGDKFNALPRYMDKATMPQIIKIIDGAVQEEEE